MFSPPHEKWACTQRRGVGSLGGKGLSGSHRDLGVVLSASHPSESEGEFSMRLWRKTN